jgi:uncharacterized metal-binding protein YceD (DUF177 family)
MAPPAHRRVAEAPPTVIFFDEIEDGATPRSFKLSVADLELEDRDLSFVGSVGVEMQIHRALEHYQVDADISYMIKGECCRCLVGTEKALQAQTRLLIQRKEASEDEIDAVEEEDDIEIVHPGVKEFDLKECLREAIMLELPMRIYANDACEGAEGLVCLDGNTVPQGQPEKSTDSRWEALANLKFPQES